MTNKIYPISINATLMIRRISHELLIARRDTLEVAKVKPPNKQRLRKYTKSQSLQSFSFLLRMLTLSIRGTFKPPNLKEKTMSDSKKVVFAADYSELMAAKATSRDETEPIQEIVRFGIDKAICIRAKYIAWNDSIKPQLWLHDIHEDGSTSPICFLPLVSNNDRSKFGGHNQSWFFSTFKEVWRKLEAQAREAMREDGSKAATDVEQEDDAAVPY